mmetsp:Transcript_34983/g.104491  ORF Transcript_34983/g.104491 Transcript_34983/m.104491 type:complete len:191 (-) Transcript_34983:78-650(-)
MTLALLSRRSPYPLQVLKEALLLRPPPPPPLVGALALLPHYYVRFVSTCAITFVSSMLVVPRSVWALATLPCAAAASVLRRSRLGIADGEDGDHTAWGSRIGSLRLTAVALLKSSRERFSSRWARESRSSEGDFFGGGLFSPTRRMESIEADLPFDVSQSPTLEVSPVHTHRIAQTELDSPGGNGSEERV